jgi:hypothetical protein
MFDRILACSKELSDYKSSSEIEHRCKEAIIEK